MTVSSRRRKMLEMGLLNPVAAAQLLLDTYPNAAAAYSLRKLRTDYSGSAIRVRESGGDTETDIGFDGNDLDEAALLAHCGANDGFVVTWYDQSGNGEDATQSSDANQPQIVIDGVIAKENGFPAPVAHNGASYMDTGIVPPVTVSIFAVSRDYDGSEDVIFFGARDSSVERSYIGSQSGKPWIGADGSQDSGAENTSMLYMSAFHGDGYADLYVDGSQEVDIAPGTVDNITHDYSLFAFNDAGSKSFHFSGAVWELIFFDSDKRTDREGIESNIDDYYFGASAEEDTIGDFYFLSVLSRSDADVGASQGVATSDGVTFWASAANSNDTLYKYTRSGSTYTLVTSRDTSADWPTGMTQINSIHYHEGVLYIGGNNYNTTPRKGWVLEYDPDALTLLDTHVTEDHWSEGGAWRNNEFWVCYANKFSTSPDVFKVSRYDSDFNHVDDHELPAWYSSGALFHQGLAWRGDFLYTMIHEGTEPLRAEIYEWDGSSFSLYRRFHPPTAQCTQGIALTSDRIWWAERNTLVTAWDSIVESAIPFV